MLYFILTDKDSHDLLILKEKAADSESLIYLFT